MGMLSKKHHTHTHTHIQKHFHTYRTNGDSIRLNLEQRTSVKHKNCNLDWPIIMWVTCFSDSLQMIVTCHKQLKIIGIRRWRSVWHRESCTALSNVLVILVRCMYASFVLYQNEIYFEFATMSRFASFYWQNILGIFLVPHGVSDRNREKEREKELPGQIETQRVTVSWTCKRPNHIQWATRMHKKHSWP